MIECKNVRICLGKRAVIEDISFSAPDGQITVLLGKNGSGKTTLLRAMAGGIPYQGSICVQTREIRSLRARQRARLIGLMPQMLPAPDITVRELVSYGRQPYTGLSGNLSAADWQAVDTVIAGTGLGALRDESLGRISGGERQKAYFAMLLAQDCPCLLLDEPGAHLDAGNMNDLSAFLTAARQEGKTVLAVLHDLNRALTIADRLVVIDSGRRIFEGPPLALSASDIPDRIFGLRRLQCLPGDGTAPHDFFL